MIHKKAHYDIAQKWKGRLEHWLRCDFLVCRKYNMTQYSRANGRKKYVHVYIHWKIRLKQISNKNNNKHLFSIQKRIIHCILQLHCINIDIKKSPSKYFFLNPSLLLNAHHTDFFDMRFFFSFKRNTVLWSTSPFFSLRSAEPRRRALLAGEGVWKPRSAPDCCSKWWSMSMIRTLSYCHRCPTRRPGTNVPRTWTLKQWINNNNICIIMNNNKIYK